VSTTPTIHCRRLIVAVAVLATAVCARKEETPAPTPTAEPTKVHSPRSLRDIVVARTPERIERGRYLSEGLLQCFVCHSERDWKKPGAPPIPALKGAGQVWPGRPWLTAPNLTPDPETGTGTWTDDMLIRAIREGISHDGRVLHPQMWYRSFGVLPDEDVESVVAYLRTLKPIKHALPKTTIPPDEAKKLEVPAPITQPVPMPPQPATDIDRGRRLAWLADCSGCHTSWYTPKNPGLFGGGNLVTRGDMKTYGANITSDDSGIKHYDAAFFREVMRTGKARGRELSPLMPWTVFTNLSDQDLDGLFAYLSALPKVKHVIDNIDTPTKCAICGGEHPLGQYNRPVELKFVPVPLDELKDAPGTYRFDDGFEVRIAIEGGKLNVKFDSGGCELVTTDRKIYFCQGEIERIEFVRDASGKITGMLNILEPGKKIR
jgi:mono/diheme cytochrome c family protein